VWQFPPLSDEQDELAWSVRDAPRLDPEVHRIAGE
jgi:hypothetical protein